MKVFDKESHKFADIFPMIEGDGLENLKQDIKEHGQLEPVILYEDKILDGRNRYRACKELGLDVKTEEYKGDKPLEFVISTNLKRRHLNASQRAVIALDILPMLEEEAKKRNIQSANRATEMQRKLSELNEKADRGDKLADWQAYILAKEYRNLRKMGKKRVYFIETKDKIKIGISDYPEVRCEEIQRHHPDAILIGHIKGDKKLEFYLHKQFENIALGHEWFEKTDYLLNEINEILDFGKNSKVDESKFHSAVQAGKQVDVSEKYVREAKKLKETSPELFEEVRMGKKNFSEVKKEQRAEKIQLQREELQKEVLEQPVGDYDVIVIDPPWNYQDDSVYNADGFRGTCPYPTMSIEQIKNIKLPAKDECVLWLWTTNKHIFDCREILNEWGFEIKSILTWDKEHIAIGRWLRSQTEHCILAVKGKPYYQNTRYGTIIREKRTEHSAKPESFYKIIEEICAGRKLDYFARKKREGWDVYGDEVKEDVKNGENEQNNNW